jgi:hypothetical protein
MTLTVTEGEALVSIADSLRRIADRMDAAVQPEVEAAIQPEVEAAIAAERVRFVASVRADFRNQRYRNIVYDGMDSVLTAVVPLRSVERALYRAVHPDKVYTLDRLPIAVIPANGEKEREDVQG